MEWICTTRSIFGGLTTAVRPVTPLNLRLGFAPAPSYYSCHESFDGQRQVKAGRQPRSGLGFAATVTVPTERDGAAAHFG